MLTKWSVKKPYSIIVAVIVIIVLGIAAMIGIRTDLLPDIDYPYAVVITNYPDASPEEVEETVTIPIEKALNSVGRVTNVSSVSREGRSIVTVEFSQSTNMDSVIAEMREVFEPLSDEWNRSVSSPVIQKVNPDSVPVIVASIDIEGSDGAGISKFLNETLMTYFDNIEGVADTSLGGIVSEQVQITIDAEKLAIVNQSIFNAIDGDYAKARAALEATDAELSTASSQLSSDLLKQTSSLDSQLRSLNSQLAQAQASLSAANQQLSATEEQITALEKDLAAYDNIPEEELSEEDLAAISEIQSSLTAARAQLANAQAGVSGNNSTVSSLTSQIAELENQRQTLTQQMSTREVDLAESKASITKQLSDLAKDEEAAKANADLQTLITTEMVSTMLASQNFSSTAGSLSLGNREYNVKVGDKISSVEELQNLVLFHFNIDGVDDVLLSEVANISLVNDSDSVYSRINGHDGVMISFLKQSDYSTVEVADNIKATCKKISKLYPEVSITLLSDQSIYIDRVTDAVRENLIIGAILAIIVLILFLHDYRPTIVVAAAIPVSLLFAIILMFITGGTLNVFSLAGLALGVGMLVDNSIVVMENIYRCRTEGLSRSAAAITGVKQVGPAIIASTLTTICVFLPIIFTKGLARQISADIGLTIAFALIASLLIAYTLVPAMSANVLRKMNIRPRKFGRSALLRYETLLRWALTHRVFIVIFAVVLLGFSAVFAVSRGSSFLPESDSTEMTLTVTMDENAREDILWENTDKIIELLMQMDDVKSVGAATDNGGTISLLGNVSEGNTTSVYVVLKDNKKHTCREIADTIRKKTENMDCHIDVSIGSYDLSSLFEEGVQINVQGEDLATLADITRDMGDLLLSVEGADHVTNTMDTATPTLKVTVNKAEAMHYGLTVSDVYDFIALSISNSANATAISENGNEGTDVIVIDGSNEDLTLADIQNLKMTVTGEDGLTSEVVVGSIATITEEEGAPVIYRDNRIRYMTAKADIADGYNVGLVSDEIRQLVDGYQPPDGYTITLSGEESAIDDSIHDLLFILALSLLLMYLIMVAQFQSLRLPLIIMFTVPLSFCGGFLALLISGKDFSIVAVIGFLLLSGIVVNNGIVLIDCIERMRRAGKGLSASIIEGCRTRLRPILMTAATTVLALLTLACGFGIGAEVVQPMAIVILGGMIYATLVSLFVIPVIYDLFLRRRNDAAVADIIGLVRPDSGTADREETPSDIFRSAEPKEETGEDEPETEKDKDEETVSETEKTPEDKDKSRSAFFAFLAKKRSARKETKKTADNKEAENDDNAAVIDDDESSADENAIFNADDDEDIAEDELSIDPSEATAEKQKPPASEKTSLSSSDEEDGEDNEDEDMDEDEKLSLITRFSLWLMDDDDEEDEDDDDEDTDEDDADKKNRDENDRPGFFRRLFNRFRDEDEEEEEDEDEDYYGLKELRARKNAQKDEKEEDRDYDD